MRPAGCAGFSRSVVPFFSRWGRQRIAPRHHLLPSQLLQVFLGTFGHTSACHARFGVFAQALRLFFLRNLAGGQLHQRLGIGCGNWLAQQQRHIAVVAVDVGDQGTKGIEQLRGGVSTALIE